MLTFVLPLVVYIMSFPVMIATLFRVELGVMYFITIVPVIAVMQKIAEFPGGNNFGDFLLISMVLGSIIKSKKENNICYWIGLCWSSHSTRICEAFQSNWF